MTQRHTDALRFFRYRLDLSRLLMVCILAFFAGSAHAAPKAKLWDRWSAHNASSDALVDHGAWNRFLGSYLVVGDDGINRLAYGRVMPEDRRALDTYVGGLADTRISEYRRDEQFAYWINLYNALTVRVVLDHYPVPSIRKIGISPGWFSFGPWGKKLVTVEGTAVSLDDIEHRILRPLWRDPRVHYSVNCAALGCPNLQPTAFTAADTDTMLDKAARDYVNHPRGVTITRDGLFASSIYKWFRDDFGDGHGGGDAAVLAHLMRYADPALRRKLEKFKRISGHMYDWSLNDTSASS